jgi:hypothetical protein
MNGSTMKERGGKKSLLQILLLFLAHGRALTSIYAHEKQIRNQLVFYTLY